MLPFDSGQDAKTKREDDGEETSPHSSAVSSKDGPLGILLFSLDRDHEIRRKLSCLHVTDGCQAFAQENENTAPVEGTLAPA